ncbi:C2 family cysteine protease [Streptomyces sp. NPDC051555]|uniref:C2 family cysteine protease n=1 Tax=Streptomyces sp. NPDC051555 TaxID=3365657 RepID=UPI003793A830
MNECKRERDRTAAGVILTTYDLGALALWGRSESPSPLDVRQGELGDCVYLSTLAALAHIDPEGIKSRITPLTNGRFKVRLDRTVEVGPLVHARPARSTGLYAEGELSSWVALMEKALAKRRSPLLGAPSYEALNGCKKMSTALKALGYGVELEDDSGDEPLEGALEIVSEGLRCERIVLAALEIGGDQSQHAHAVLGVSSNMVRLYDPYGSQKDLTIREFEARVRAVTVSTAL